MKSNSEPLTLCKIDGCRLVEGHAGKHNQFPSVWSHFDKKDIKKLDKAGFATPRGGDKNAYQNHVSRSNKVIIPFERIEDVELDLYKDGYDIRLLPEQFFKAKNQPHLRFSKKASNIVVGENAFILYRTWDSYKKFPPLKGWKIRSLKKGRAKSHSRGKGIKDTGHYLLRMNAIGENKKKHEGPPQGIFATEYANEETSFLCKCVLSLFTINCYTSPYTLNHASHLKAVLEDAGLLDFALYENNGTLRRGYTCCPLCLKTLKYSELHETVSFTDSSALANAGVQVEGSTRSTIVNLFHLVSCILNSIA